MKGKEYAIVGGGIVGLSLAYKLLKTGNQVTLFERESSLAFHQSGNNSGVLHSGISYPVGSLKSKLCIEGYHQMIDYCEKNKLKYSLCGKYLFASGADQYDYLEKLYSRANKIDLKGVKILSKAQIVREVPELNAEKALWIPQTGIINYRLVCDNLANTIIELGGKIKLNANILNVQGESGKICLEQDCLTFDHVIVAAGNNTLSLSSNIELQRNYRILSIKGEYYEAPIPKTLNYCIYPLPDPNLPFLGLHCHPDRDGKIEVGPTAIICKDEYQFDKTLITFNNLIPIVRYAEVRKMIRKNFSFTIQQIFLRFSQRYFNKQVKSFLNLADYAWKYKRSGIRAQLVNREGELINDFRIEFNKKATYLINVPSPAATASFAIADYIINEINKTS
tara:strand:- start:1410 stop:2588 length:1179 start_codon:yes stop_codon:yes gene_type:complete